ncbi:MAG: CHC2 zinc finger domain-containing protein [Pseudomonadota bacterium]
MPAQILLNRCEKVRQTGHNRWVACCPAHDDKTPSLAVTETDDGRVLFHCHAGCEAQAVLAVVGLRFADLMPNSLLGHSHKPVRTPFDARQILSCISLEANVIGIIAEKYSELIDAEDGERLWLAWERINKATLEHRLPGGQA